MSKLSLLLLLPLAGCAALPDTVGPEFEHMSHVSQHFGPSTTNYGANMAGITARWQRGRVYGEVSEAIDLDRRYPHSCGEITGPREEFSARIGYGFEIKH